jgi:hypothetical protein
MFWILPARVWVIQNSFVVPTGGLQQMYAPAESLFPLAYAHARMRLTESPNGGDSFVLEPNELASMLFDCDPESTVEFALTNGPLTTSVVIQRMRIENVRFSDGPQRILAEVRGRWTGAIYVREFTTPNGRPYVFLGRHRVLVHSNSPLTAFLEELKAQGRLTKIADTVALLKQDEAGYSSKELSGLI